MQLMENNDMCPLMQLMENNDMCPRMPRSILVLRNRALLLQRQDARAPAASAAEEIDCLYFLSWTGRGSWLPGRPDRRRQPAQEALEAALIFMREAIIEYSATRPSVWPLPRHSPCPHFTHEEEVLFLAIY